MTPKTTILEEQSARLQLATSKWKHGFRWCETSNQRCMSLGCLEDDVCGQVVSGDSLGSAENALKAHILNKTLRK